MITVKSIVSGGKLQPSPITGFFRSWLRGRKPSIILAFFWLYYYEGALLAFHVDGGFFPTRKPVRIYSPKPVVSAVPKWWEEVA